MKIVPDGAKGSEARAAKLKAATADFSQKDFDVARAIDGRPDTHWAIFPEMGKPHWAAFEFESPVELDAGAALVVTLEFQSEFGAASDRPLATLSVG